MLELLLIFTVVFLLNLIPAFAPPTWMVFSFLGFRFPDHMGWRFALAGALAATLGRFTLAKLSRAIVRKRFLSEQTRRNVDAIKDRLEKHPKLTFGIFLFYAFTPLPSNYLFIAYGLTTLRLTLITVPFFLGRFVSYSFWVFTAAAVSRRIAFDDADALSYFSAYFVSTQLLLLGLVYFFTRIDWRILLAEKRFRWLERQEIKSPGGIVKNP